jgi:type IV secretory pathway VirJ component
MHDGTAEAEADDVNGDTTPSPPLVTLNSELFTDNYQLATNNSQLELPMPHDIDQTTGVAAVFTAGDPPWHGLGRNVAEAVDSLQAIKLAGLNWLVE